MVFFVEVDSDAWLVMSGVGEVFSVWSVFFPRVCASTNAAMVAAANADTKVTPFRPSTLAQPANQLSTCAYPLLSHGKPVKSVARNHSESVQALAQTITASNEEVNVEVDAEVELADELEGELVKARAIGNAPVQCTSHAAKLANKAR